MAGISSTQIGNTAAAQTGPTVTSGQTNLGKLLTGPDGRTLYMFTKDTSGVSNCTGACLQNWPPLTVPDGTTPTAESGLSFTLGTITRTDTAAKQVTLAGKPLYYWAADQAAGQTGGQGIGGFWFVLDTSGAAVPVPAATVGSGKTNLGDVLTGPEGKTLYVFTKDTSGVSNCTGGCLQNWPPLTVTAGTTPVAASGLSLTLGTITRTDTGATQVTLNSKPLYYWAADQAPGQATGQGVGGVWFALGKAGVAVPLPATPPTATPAAPSAPSTGNGVVSSDSQPYQQIGFLLICVAITLGGITLSVARRR